MLLAFRPGVVAPDFKVHRTTNLRVVDASVIPFTFSVAPFATVHAIAEKVIYSLAVPLGICPLSPTDVQRFVYSGRRHNKGGQLNSFVYTQKLLFF